LLSQRRVRLLLLLLACSERPDVIGGPDAVDFAVAAVPPDLEFPVCQSGSYEWACASDCLPNGPDPRCPGSPVLQKPCTYRGLECDSTEVVTACDCNGVEHCLKGACPFGMDMPCGDLTCGPSQICVQVGLDTAPHCVDVADPSTACLNGCDCFGPDPCVPFGGTCWQVTGRAVTCLD
jgi:hypothetical protein